MSRTMYDFASTLKKYQNDVNRALDSYFSVREPMIFDAMRYSIAAGGKRIRPVLSLASCELCGAPYRKAMLFACALEIIHTYSLIYDDLPCMDNDTLRRGKPTNHVVFGEDVALLAGMGLYARSFEILHEGYRSAGLTESQLIEGEEVLLRASGIRGIVMGQYLDIENVSENPDADEAYIRRVHALKTSAMLEASVLTGAICAGATEAQREALLTYARTIGLAFQIRDDILDVVGTAEQMGKTLGKDKKDKKVTFVDIFGIDRAQKELLRLTEEGKDALRIFNGKDAFLRDLADYLCIRTN